MVKRMINPIKRKKEKSYWARREANKIPRKYRCDIPEEKIDQFNRLRPFLEKTERENAKRDDATLTRNLYSGELQKACSTCKNFLEQFNGYFNHSYIPENADCTCMYVRPEGFRGRRQHILAGTFRAYSEFPPEGYKFTSTTDPRPTSMKLPEDNTILVYPNKFTNTTLETFNFLEAQRYVYQPIYDAASYGDLKSIPSILATIPIIHEYGYTIPQRVWNNLHLSNIGRNYEQLCEYLNKL
jgi:hypothetical protein